MTIKTLMGNGAITGRRISGDHFFLPYIVHSSKFTFLHSFICRTSSSYSVFYTFKILCLQTVVKMWLTYAKIEFIKILSMLVESTGINSGKKHGR